MPNNRHRQIERLKNQEILRARREFAAKGYDYDKTVEALQRMVKAVMPSIQEYVEKISRAIHDFGVAAVTAAEEFSENMRKV